MQIGKWPEPNRQSHPARSDSEKIREDWITAQGLGVGTQNDDLRRSANGGSTQSLCQKSSTGQILTQSLISPTKCFPATLCPGLILGRIFTYTSAEECGANTPATIRPDICSPSKDHCIAFEGFWASRCLKSVQGRCRCIDGPSHHSDPAT